MDLSSKENRIINSKRLADDIFEFHVCYYNEDGTYSVHVCCDNSITLSIEVIKETYFKMIKNQKLYTSTNDSDE